MFSIEAVIVGVIALLLVVGYRYHVSDAAVVGSTQVVGQVRYVVDGDSLYLQGYQPQIRLWGVDAPEKGEAGYHTARRALNSSALGQVLTCQIVETDRYGRTVARCFLKSGREVNRLMIESGSAAEYLRYSKGFYSR